MIVALALSSVVATVSFNEVDQAGLAQGASEDRRALAGFARCMMASQPKATRKLVVSPDLHDRISDIVDGTGGCVLPERGQVEDSMLRGTLAESAYAVDFGKGTLAKITPAQWDSALSGRSKPMKSMVLCLQHKAPTEVENFILSPVASKEEELAVVPVLKLLATCSEVNTETAQIDLARLRAVTALWVYRTADYFLKYKPSLAGAR